MTDEEQHLSLMRTYLDLGSVEAIAQKMANDMTSWTGGNGEQAKVAIDVLNARALEAATTDLKDAVRSMDRSSTRLQVAAVVLAVAAVVLTAVQVFG